MQVQLSGLHIGGITATIPKHSESVDIFKDVFGEKKIKRIKKSTGVEVVHTVPKGVTASDLCFDAASRLINELDIASDSIDGILFVSFSPDYKAPATSIILQNRLNLNTESVAMDINYGCSAFVYGLYQAGLLIKAGGCKRVLLCTGDTQSKMINEKDRAMKMIVGDAGTATIIEEGQDTFNFYLKAIGAKYDKLIIPAGGYRQPCSEETKKEIRDEDGNIRTAENLYMNGMEVMKFALTEVPPAVDKVLNMAVLKKADINLFAFHQPNKLILDYLSNSMGISSEKMPVGLQQTGNTGSASIPLLLTVLKERGFDFGKAENVIACGFGIGLSLGAVNINLSNSVVLGYQEM